MTNNPLMNPTNLRSAAQFDKAREILTTILGSTDPDEMGDAIEAAASDADLAQAVIFRLVVVARGWDTVEGMETGVELVARALNPSGVLLVIEEPS